MIGGPNLEELNKKIDIAKQPTKYDKIDLKNIKPKNISLKFIPTPYCDVILSLAFYICHYEFGLVSFPPNIWDMLLYNVYSGDIKGKYGRLLGVLYKYPEDASPFSAVGSYNDKLVAEGHAKKYLGGKK